MEFNQNGYKGWFILKFHFNMYLMEFLINKLYLRAYNMNIFTKSFIIL